MNLLLIKELAEKKGITITSLANASGMTSTNLHRCIRENKIQAQHLEKIASQLKVSICTFFEDNGHIVVNGNQNQVNNKEAKQVFISKEDIAIKYLNDLLKEKDAIIENKNIIIAEKERMIEFLLDRKSEK